MKVRGWFGGLLSYVSVRVYANMISSFSLSGTMSLFSQFEDILVWQHARQFSQFVYSISTSGAFKHDFSLKDQIQRAANSVPLNIAEGFARQTDKEFKQFLFIAHGSIAEVQSALYLARDREFIDKQTFDSAYKQAEKISKMLMGLIKYLSKSNPR